ncbi:GNAT family N-acetyltransferase [Streptomyces sp. NPDC059224]|uniref:GNAT family N-acetyltransferase n=1 Tax=Streptomyces sp. NPDC059224 TaxID=3346775 RepID=UPI0036C5A125
MSSTSQISRATGIASTAPPAARTPGRFVRGTAGLSRTTPVAVTVYALEGPAALAWMKDRWPALYRHDAGATPFGSPNWLLGWAGQLPPTAVPLLLVAADQSGVQGALALVRESRDGRSIVRAMSAHCECITVVGPGSQDPRVAEALARELTQLTQDGTSVTLPNVPARSPLNLAMRSQPGWAHTACRAAAVALPLTVAVLPRSIRRQHERREQVLSDCGAAITYRRTRTHGDLLAALPVLQALHAKQRQLAAEDGDPWEAVLRRLGAAEAFIAEVAMDGAVIAAQLCLVRGRHCYSVLPAMDPAHRGLAPGHALLRRLIDDLTGSGFSWLDLGPTRETPGQIAYKAQYQPVWDAVGIFTSTSPQSPGGPLAGQLMETAHVL